MPNNYASVQQSFNRCLMQRDFLRRFYTVFLGRDPRIGEKFQNTDWDTQIHLLRHGISSCLVYADGGELGQHEIKRLAKSHSKKGYNVAPWMYDEWLEALIEAIWEKDPEIDDALEQRWREALSHGIKRMQKG